jgi:hypothetical protein
MRLADSKNKKGVAGSFTCVNGIIGRYNVQTILNIFFSSTLIRFENEGAGARATGRQC